MGGWVRLLRPRRLLTAVLVLVVATAITIGPATGQSEVGPPAPAGPEPDSPPEAASGLLSILVMGDSYSAGNGAGSYYGPRGCRRSAHNYGREFERIVEVAPYAQRSFVEVVACSGAETSSIGGWQGDRSPQIDAVNAGYDLIFLTIGGNDANFADIAKYCLVRATRSYDQCGPRLIEAYDFIQNTYSGRLAYVLRLIRGRADWRTRIVLVGYPFLERSDDFRLRIGSTNQYIEVAQILRDLGRRANAVQRSVVNRLNDEAATDTFAHVPMTSVFRGHELMAGSWIDEGRWFVEPIADAGLNAIDTWYHPNATGHRQEASALVSSALVPKYDLNESTAPWQSFSFGEAGSRALTLRMEVPRGGAVVQLVDAYCPGDRFTVVDNGTVRRTTTDVANVGCGSLHTSDPNAAIGDANWSRGTYFFGPGTHRVLVRVARNASGTTSGDAFFRSTRRVTIESSSPIEDTTDGAQNHRGT